MRSLQVLNSKKGSANYCSHEYPALICLYMPENEANRLKEDSVGREWEELAN
jgi:hypothetical protein